MHGVGEVLQAFFPGGMPSAGSAARSAAGFSGATVWRIECAGGQFALRRWPQSPPPRARLQGLHRLLAHAHGRGATPLAVPVPNRHGMTLSELGGRLWQLEPWKPGAADFWSDPSPARLAAAMHCLATFHRAASGFPCRPAEAEWFAGRDAAVSPAVRDRLRILTEWRTGERDRLRAALAVAPHGPLDELARETAALFDRLADRIAAGLAEAARRRIPLRPCLRDVWHDHVLFMGDEVTGLIDPSACRCDCVATDLARLLDSLLGDDAERWRWAIDAYRQREPLTPAEESLIPILDQSGVLLSGMSWLRKCYLAGGIAADEARVIGRLERIVRRLRTMTGSLSA